MFKNIKFFALALLVTAASVSFAQENPLEGVISAPVDETAQKQDAPKQDEDQADKDQDNKDLSNAPKECKYKLFVQKYKKSFLGAGSAAIVAAALLGYSVYNKRAKAQTAAR